MNLKNPKIWGSIIAIVLAVVGALTQMDLKGAVCGEASALVESK
jgi:hypothetical protein